MTNIKIDSIPFMIGDKSVAEIEVGGINFEALALCGSRAKARAETSAEVGKLVEREKISVMAKFKTTSGETIAIDEKSLLQMPSPYARKLYAALNPSGGKEGKILNEGDGVTTAILYELGTPIKMQDGAEITELEFIAKTLGDIEDILVLDGQVDQTLELVRKIAQPISPDVKMLSLPSWAVSQISVADGITIMNKVLPAFL